MEALNAVGRVPFVITGGPWEDGVKGFNKVVKTPGQDHDVVGVTEEHNDHGGVTQT